MKMNNQPLNGKNQPVKAYNMAILGDNSAEINLYGDVVSVWPVDWWTGEKIPGNYIALDEFLKDLEDIKDKENITLHINSGGGELYAGLAIYNRLKALKGTITTINDGLAASAASLIFQAGDVRKMNAGSNLMAHGVAGFLYGYYNVEDLKELITEFKAHNKAVVNVYAEAMGVSYEEAKSFVEGETWLTGEEAVNKGLADEVIKDGVEDTVTNNFIQRLANRARNAHQAQFPGMGAPAPEVDPAPTPATAAVNLPIANNTDSIETGGNDNMDFKTVEELKNAFPELVADIENAARAGAQNDGAANERARIQAIEAIENTIADKDLIKNAKYGEKPLTAEQLALQALQAQAQIGANMLNNLEEDAAGSGAEDIAPTPNGGAGKPEEENVEASAKDAVALFNKTKAGGK